MQVTKSNIARVAWNFLLVMIIYSLMRMAFFLMHHDVFADVTPAHLAEMMLGGLRFDLTALLYLNLLYFLLALLPLPAEWKLTRAYQAATRWSFLVPNALGIIANAADMVYFRFSDRRTTCAFFREFEHDNNIGHILLESITQYWLVWLLGIALLVALYFLYRPLANNTASRKTLYYIRESVIALLAIYFIVIGIRGGFGKYTRPITISNAMQYVNRPAETGIVLNTPFTLIKSLEYNPYQNPHYFPDEELEQIMSPIHAGETAGSRPNVVVLILESFGTEHIAEYAPFLDSLMHESVSFTHSYASGRKSIDAMPSVLSSIPMLIEPYIVTPYATNEVSSFATVLDNYHTAFFHGAPNGSMGFQAYARSAGFQQYIGKTEFEAAHPEADAFDGTWAIWDEEFLQFFAEEMSRMEEPFCTSVFTASSHHPFRIPERYEGIFKDGPKPLCRCISYSDMALRRFFETASRQPWFEHTLFVLTADHTNQAYHAEYLTDEGLYRVPIAFYASWLEPRLDTINVVSQIDILPSVLGVIGHPGDYFAFGEDALTRNKLHNYAICYNHPYFQIIAREGMLQFDGEQVVGSTGNLTEEQSADMLRYLKAFIQQYISRITENRLTVWQK